MPKMISLSISFLLAFAGNAFAHHPLGGEVPETMFHGWAYSTAIVGAEAAPLMAYFFGFNSISWH
tara:strand:- start:61 stop:255 length:195 start_codon:yes stop_codon:yes gene_type:complete